MWALWSKTHFHNFFNSIFQKSKINTKNLVLNFKIPNDFWKNCEKWIYLHLSFTDRYFRHFFLSTRCRQTTTSSNKKYFIFSQKSSLGFKGGVRNHPLDSWIQKSGFYLSDSGDYIPYIYEFNPRKSGNRFLVYLFAQLGRIISSLKSIMSIFIPGNPEIEKWYFQEHSGGGFLSQ